MFRLILKKFDGSEEIFSPLEREISIGRNDPAHDIINHIDLADTTVSRRHTRIFFEDQAFFIEDLDSVNGTWVNDQKISKTKLRPGDSIRIGRNFFTFESDGTKSINPTDFLVTDALLDQHKTIDANYFILQQLSRLLITKRTLLEFLHAVMDMVRESLATTKGVLLLTDSEGRPRHLITTGKDALFSREVVEQALERRQSLLVGFDFEASRTMVGRGVHSAICAPLLKGQEVLGAIYLEDPLPGRFTDADLILLTLFANQVAAGIENVTLNENLHKESRLRSNLERFLSPKVVELVTKDSLDKGDIVLKTERLQATVLFTDIQGFTVLCEQLDPQETADLLSRHFTLMSDIIFLFEGTLDKYVGDGLVAVFGAPFPSRDHALRAVKCALLMQERHQSFLKNLAERLRFAIRIGVNTGEILAGYMGSPKRMEYTVLGEPVVIAQRLQSLAQPGRVYLGKATHEAVKDQVATEFIARMETPKGKKEMEVYRVLQDVPES